ncbi:MAG: FAD-dependent oxidoreductase [Pseudomonadota bacterium]
MQPFQPSLTDHDHMGLPLFGQFDIVVLGGGPAGIAAAATASEAGHNTRLIERLGFCGGAAVCGMSGTICGLYNTVEAIRAPRSRNN